MVSQDIRVKWMHRVEMITFRYALFDIPGYDARIYSYEPEVLYGYSVPAYQGKGMRICLVVKMAPVAKVDIWIRGGLTRYTDRQVVGTGPDQTIGNTRAELTAQIMVRL
jgi:hypothetical protein